MTLSIESYLQTINQLEYEIALKDQALNVANTLIAHLREEVGLELFRMES